MDGVNRSRMIALFLIVIATIVLPSAWAQQASPSVPQIIVSGSAEILLPATKASFSIGIMTSASSANAANEDNARITKSVIEALHGAHLSAGLRESFIDHVVATPPDDMWYPTRSELENAGVIMPDRAALVN
jgi:uncharacterized protein YggE